MHIFLLLYTLSALIFFTSHLLPQIAIILYCSC